MLIEGQEYNLRLDLTAMRDFEQETGKNIFRMISDAMRSISVIPQLMLVDDKEEAAKNNAKFGAEILQSVIEVTDFSVSDIPVLLWAAIGGSESGLTVREAGRLVTVKNFMEVGGALVGAIMEALPLGGEGEPAADDGDDPTQSPTG